MAFCLWHRAHAGNQSLLLGLNLSPDGGSRLLLLLPFQIMFITKGIIHHGLVFKYKHRICYLADEVTVMGHKKNGSLIGAERGFQILLCPYIHVVGRFVQDQEIGAALQQFSQHQPCLFPAGQGGHLFLRLPAPEQVCTQDASGILLCKGRENACKMFKYRFP